ncbi:hypothetical protein S83_050655 [Arachis hypogaea]
MVVLQASRYAPSPVTTTVVVECCRDTMPCLNFNLRHLSSILEPPLHSCCHRRRINSIVLAFHPQSNSVHVKINKGINIASSQSQTCKIINQEKMFNFNV